MAVGDLPNIVDVGSKAFETGGNESAQLWSLDIPRIPDNVDDDRRDQSRDAHKM